MPGANMPDWDRYFVALDDYIKGYEADAELQRDWINNQQTLLDSSIRGFIDQLSPEIKQSFDFGSELRDIYRSQTVPAVQRFMADAEGYDTERRRTQEASRAFGAVRMAQEAQDRSERSQLSRAGIDPNDPRFARARQYDDPQQAAQAAAASNLARERVEDRGFALRGQAIDLGQNLGQMGQRYTQIGQSQAAAIPAAVTQGVQTGGALQGLNQQTWNAQNELMHRMLQFRMDRYRTGAGVRAAGGGGMAGGLGSALGTLAGAGLGAWLAAPTGGMSIAAGAALGGQLGGSVGGGLLGGGQQQLPSIY